MIRGVIVFLNICIEILNCRWNRQEIVLRDDFFFPRLILFPLQLEYSIRRQNKS